MQGRIETVQAEYASLVGELESLDTLLVEVQAKEDAKAAELRDRRSMLSERVRSAYDADRTSMLETVLSGGTFTDLHRGDELLDRRRRTGQGACEADLEDQETLAEIHQTVEDTRAQTNELRQETAAQKRELDRSLAELQGAGRARGPRGETETALAKQNHGTRRRPGQGARPGRGPGEGRPSSGSRSGSPT